MESWTHVLLLLSMASIISCAPLAQDHWDTKVDKTITKTIEIFNKATKADFIFKVNKDEKEFRLNGPDGQIQTKFTIKETECQKSDSQINTVCEFKTDGMMKICAASISVEETTFSVICRNITPETNWNRNEADDMTHIQDSNAFGESKLGEGFPQDHVTAMKKRDNGAGDGKIMKRDINGFSMPELEIIIREDGNKLILEHGGEAYYEDDHPLSSPRDSKPTSSRKPVRGSFLGRMLCLECIFNNFSKK